MKFDIFFTLFDGSLTFCKQIEILAFTSTQTHKERYHGNKMGSHKLSKSSSSKSY